MTRTLLTTAILLIAGTAAGAACFADYKAKKDDPLRLHYGVAEIRGACTVENAEAELAPRLAAEDWELLNIVDVFDESGLAEREASAGDHYLRY